MGSASRIRRHALAALSIAAIALAALAPEVMAADGHGLYGRTNDKVITFASFGVIAFFAILVTVLSLLQMRFDNRKERRRHDLERFDRS
jgi:putative copper export protein